MTLQHLSGALASHPWTTSSATTGITQLSLTNPSRDQRTTHASLHSGARANEPGAK
jgi:hypothetical protein